MLAIRLSRVGTKNKRKFRVIVQEKGASPKRGFLEIIGAYDPEAKPHSLTIDKDRLTYWMEHGAKPSNTVEHLIKLDPAKSNQYKKKNKKTRAAEAAAKEAAAKEAEAKAAEAEAAKQAAAAAAEAPKEEPKPEEKPTQ